MNGNPSAEQKRWHQWLREHGCCMTGDANPEIDHIKGSKYKIKGQIKPGEWMVLPLSSWLHTNYNNPLSIKTKGRRGFEVCHEVTFKDLWIGLVEKYEREKGEKPMDDGDYNEIVDRGFRL